MARRCLRPWHFPLDFVRDRASLWDAKSKHDLGIGQISRHRTWPCLFDTVTCFYCALPDRPWKSAASSFWLCVDVTSGVKRKQFALGLIHVCRPDAALLEKLNGSRVIRQSHVGIHGPLPRPVFEARMKRG